MAKQCVAALAGLLLAGFMTAAKAADGGANSAHDIAQKFSGGGPVDGEQARRAEDAKRRAAEKAREAARKAAQAKREAEDARREAEQLRADESEMLARARAEAEQRRADDRRLSGDEARIEEERRAEAASRLREAEEKAKQAERAAKDAEERRIVEEHRVETAQIRESAGDGETYLEPGEAYDTPRRPLPQPPPERAALGGPDREPETARAFDDYRRESSTRVTVLLIMDPGHRGIRRFGRRTADPMICLSTRCYIGAGADSPATELTRSRAFGAGVALGSRADACRNSLTCVFRDVNLGAETAALQPIDLRILRHDRRETRTISADRSCGVRRGRLVCGETVVARDYRAWIVPERIADEAGPAALREALASGLDDDWDRPAFVER